MERLSSWWAYITGVSSTVMGSLTAQDVAFYVGIVTTVGTFIINWYYKAQEAKRNASKSQD